MKPLQIFIFCTQLMQEGDQHGPRPKWNTNVFARNIKIRSSAFRNSLFIKISYVLVELWIFFYFVWCFLSKKCHFQLKQQPMKKNYPLHMHVTKGEGIRRFKNNKMWSCIWLNTIRTKVDKNFFVKQKVVYVGLLII